MYTPQDDAINIDDGVFDFDLIVNTFFAQYILGKKSSGMNLYLLAKTYIKKSSRSTCTFDLTLTHKHVIDSQISS